MTRNHLVIAAATLLASVTAASADGMNSYAAAAPEDRCGGGRFAGAYIGASVGYVESDLDVDELNSPSISGSDESFAAGGLVGYNVQCGRVLFGVEADLSWTDLDTHASFPDPIHTNSTIDWFGTVRGRLGLVHDDRVLFFVTGGLAFADVDHTLFDPVNLFSRTDDERLHGWTVGGGVELACSDNWLIRAEGLYVDLEDEKHFYTLGGGCGGVCTADSEWDDSFWVGRIALSYRFGGREPEPVPLK